MRDLNKLLADNESNIQVYIKSPFIKYKGKDKPRDKKKRRISMSLEMMSIMKKVDLSDFKRVSAEEAKKLV